MKPAIHLLYNAGSIKHYVPSCNCFQLKNILAATHLANKPIKPCWSQSNYWWNAGWGGCYVLSPTWISRIVKQFVIADRCCSTLEGMENYTKLGKLGEGTYGVVYKVVVGHANISAETSFRRWTKWQSKMWRWKGFIWKQKVKECLPRLSGENIQYL